jgi:molecular chaperone DnaK
MLVNEAREAVKSEAPLDRVRELTSELQQIQAGLGAARSAGAGSRAPRSESSSGGSASDDDVIDADFDRA